MNIQNQKIGLALGGGAARGCAHLGVIKALEEIGIKPDFIAGTSIGALVGGIYAGGKYEELVKFAEGVRWNTILPYLDVRLLRQAVLKGQKTEALIDGFLEQKRIEELSIPFCAVSTDIETGKEVQIQSGSLLEAIRASISLPGVFEPLKKNGQMLVDGGLVNPLPINAVRAMGAEFVIAVDLNHDLPSKSVEESDDSFLDRIRSWFSNDEPSIFDILGWSMMIMQYQITEKNLITSPADLLICPKVGHIRAADFHKAKEMMEEGYVSAHLAFKSLV